MGNEPFAPRTDLVDDAFWIETSLTLEPTTAPWRPLEVAQAEPPRWVPHAAPAAAEVGRLTPSVPNGAEARPESGRRE